MPPSALYAQGFLSVPQSPAAAPCTSSIWSNDPPSLQIQLLLKIKLYSFEFYRELELKASKAWSNGAQSLIRLHPGMQLPLWYLPFAAKLIEALLAQQHWHDAWAFFEPLLSDPSPPHLSYILPATLNLFNTIGHDMKFTGTFRTSNLPVLFSRSKIAGPFIDTFAAALTAQLQASDKPVADIYFGSTQFMGWMRWDDGEWNNFDQSKWLTAVHSLAISHTKPFNNKLNRLVNSLPASDTEIFACCSYRALFKHGIIGLSTSLIPSRKRFDTAALLAFHLMSLIYHVFNYL
jgi:hypothetical protein